jgi:hypothetical protein
MITVEWLRYDAKILQNPEAQQRDQWYDLLWSPAEVERYAISRMRQLSF